MSRTVVVDTECEDARRVARLVAGTKVEVRTGFDRAWAGGFEVVDCDGDELTVRRLSDGRVLPRSFAIDDVRRARRDDDLWWV